MNHVFMTRQNWEKINSRYGEDITNWGLEEMYKWAISLDVSPTTGKPGWKSYREKRDHASVLINTIKRGLQSGRITMDYKRDY